MKWLIVCVGMALTLGCAIQSKPQQCPLEQQWQKHRFTFTDAQAYCRWVNQIDQPDRRYIGPSIPDAIKKTFDERRQSLPATDEIHWRCQQGKLWYCVSHQRQDCQPALVAKAGFADVWHVIKE